MQPRPKALFLTPHDVTEPKTGAMQRTRALYTALALHRDVDVLVVPEEQKGARPLGIFGRRLALARQMLGPIRPYVLDRIARDKVRDRIAQVDYSVVVVRYLSTYFRIGAISHPRMIIDFDDDPVEAYRSLFLDRPLRLAQRVQRSYALTSYRVRANEAVAAARQIWLANNESVPKWSRAVYMPNVSPEGPPLAYRTPETSRFIFVANMEYGANIDALNYYCDHIYPILRKRAADTSLLVCGWHSPELLQNERYRDCNVSFAGYVSDIRQAYAECCAAVAPIVSGSGTSIKVMEAMSLGVPCISTPLGFRGYQSEIAGELPQVVGADPRDFADKMLSLRGNVETNLSIGRACTDFARRHWSTTALAARVAQALEDL